MSEIDIIHFVLFCHAVCFVCVIWILRDIGKHQRVLSKMIFKLSRQVGLTTKIKSPEEQNGSKCQPNSIDSLKNESSGEQTQ